MNVGPLVAGDKEDYAQDQEGSLFKTAFGVAYGQAVHVHCHH